MSSLTLFERLEVLAALHDRCILHAYNPGSPTRACVWCGLCVEGPVNERQQLLSVGQVHASETDYGASVFVLREKAVLVDSSYLRCYEVIRGAQRG